MCINFVSLAEPTLRILSKLLLPKVTLKREGTALFYYYLGGSILLCFTIYMLIRTQRKLIVKLSTAVLLKCIEMCSVTHLKLILIVLCTIYLPQIIYGCPSNEFIIKSDR